MNICNNYRQMISAFDNNHLTIEQEEDFVNHVLECKDCQEEYEIFYLTKYGLDDNYDSTLIDKKYFDYIDNYNFKDLVNIRIKDSIIRCNLVRLWNRINFVRQILVDLTMILLIIGYFIIKFW